VVGTEVGVDEGNLVDTIVELDNDNEVG
jgi:hypothetical protein